MNKPPSTFTPVPHARMHQFVSQAARSAGLPQEKAEILAEMLVGNDLRGVFSHGTQQIATYARLMRDGVLNADPQIQIVKESLLSAIVDGDGGLGYFPSREASTLVIEKASQNGIAITMSRNHGHFGAAGLYTRMSLGSDLLMFVTSGHQLNLNPDKPLYDAGGGSPMSFSAPTLQESPLVLDFGATHDLYASNPHRDTLSELSPGIVLRSIGLGEICQAWGGLLSGLAIDAAKPRWTYEGANQGGLFLAFRIDLFADAGHFKQEMDEYVREVRKLKPIPGIEACYLPGGPEAECEQNYRKVGIPLGTDHRKALEDLARDLDVAVPWSEQG